MLSPEEIISLCRKTEQGTFLPFHVQPRASATAITGLFGNALKVALNAPPVDGKANAALCAFLAKKCGVSKSSVSVTAGETNRNKTLFFRGLTPEEISNALAG